MSSPSLNLSPTPVKAHPLPTKLLQLVFILASDLQHTTNRALFKIDPLLRLVRLVPLACMVYLFLAAVLSLTSVHLFHLKVPIFPRSPLRCPAVCHELTPSTIYKARCYIPRTPSLLNIGPLSLSRMMAIKATTIYTIAVNFLRKSIRMNVLHATSSPKLMRSPPMKTIGLLEERSGVLTTISSYSALIRLQTQLLNTNPKTTARISRTRVKYPAIMT